MKPLIAVMTCHTNRAAADAIRKTWGKNSPISLRYFVGRTRVQNPPRPDEIVLDVPDTYKHLVYKVRETFRWARANGFTHVWKADDDCFLTPARLLRSGLLQYDHVGHWAQPVRRVVGDIECNGFIHGGASYLVGERALPVLCESPINTVSEDLWSTYWIERAGMKSQDDPRFTYQKRVFGDPMPQVPSLDNNLIASGEFITLAGGRSEMFTVHRKFMEES